MTAPQMWVISLRNRFRNGKMPGPAVTTHPSKIWSISSWPQRCLFARGAGICLSHCWICTQYGHYAVCFFFMCWLKQNKCSKQKLQMSCTNKLVRINQASTSLKSWAMRLNLKRMFSFSLLCRLKRVCLAKFDSISKCYVNHFDSMSLC